MQSQHFRLRIDLSKFYHDARQFCWIFVDGSKIQHIDHVKQHIRKLFNIAEPFHLQNDKAYLPPMEDVRILKENETILVVPGSGINDEAAMSTSAVTSVVDVISEATKAKTCNGAAHDKKGQASNINIADTKVRAYEIMDVSNNISNGVQPVSKNTTMDMTFHTVIEDTEADTDSKVTDYSNLTEDCDVTELGTPLVKRKRVRKRKLKNKSKLVTSPLNTNVAGLLKKPKIIDSFVISSGKHIRFDDIEAEQSNISREKTEVEKNISQKLPKRSPSSIIESVIRRECQKSMKSIESIQTMQSNYANKISNCKDLSALLALKGSSTPITFVKKIKDDNKMESMSEEEINYTNDFNIIKENNSSPEDNSYGKQIKKETQHHKSLLQIDPGEIPIMTRKPHVGDTIAFKTLKIATDYTPQVSNFIIGKVLNFCAQSTTYILKILEGREEIEMPSGKFSVSEDESVCDSVNEITFSGEQIREPRLVV